MATTSVSGAGRAKFNANQRHNQDGGASVEARKLRKKRVAAVDQITAPMAPRSSAGLSKPGAFAVDAEAAGWTVVKSIDPADRTVKTVLASRGSADDGTDETLEMTWTGNAMTTPGRHTAGERSVSVLNAAAGRRILAVSPEDVVRVLPERGIVERKPRTIETHVPWNADATDAELREMVQGRKLQWSNPISGNEEEDRVPVTGEIVPGTKSFTNPKFYTNNHLSITQSPDGLRRVLSWCGSGGFRACYVESIYNVR